MKAILVILFLPLAHLQRALERSERLWAFCRLQAGIASKLDLSVVVQGCPELRGTRNIRFGHGLMLYRELYLETQERGVICIEDDVVISRGVHIVAFDRVHIGAGTMIGEYSSVRDADHNFTGCQPLRTSGYTTEPIHIGSNVWIGRGVTILKGISIGDNAVIAANAVVTHDVGAGTTVAGVPARMLYQGVMS